MKKTAAILMTLVLLLTVLNAFAGGESGADSGSDPVALSVGTHEVTGPELESAATLYIFEAALECAGYGYEFEILDRLNIEDEVDKLVFDLKSWYVAQDLAEGMGLYPLNEEAAAAAAAEAEAEWEHYREIAWSENGLAFLPAGIYQSVENDPEGNMLRYFASFGLTKNALYEEAVRKQTEEELKKAVTASMTGKSEDEIINEYTDWFLEKMDEVTISENTEVIAEVIDSLAQDPSENQDGDGYEAFERSILIGEIYYTLGESTIRDFELNGWTWTQEADGRFAFRVTEDGNYFYARTDNGLPDGKLIMVDMMYAYEIGYEYLGIGFDTAYNPDANTDIWTLLEETYGGEYTDDGVLQARTAVSGGTLLMEVSEGALRLTLEE